MSNHVHLLVQPLTTDLSSGIHALAFRYAQHFNRQYKRRGYLYQGRFKAIIVQSGNYLMQLIRYIHLNPVRANVVGCAENYQWSSHLAYAGRASYVWLCNADPAPFTQCVFQVELQGTSTSRCLPERRQVPALQILGGV